jgi:hypothetical protein
MDIPHRLYRMGYRIVIMHVRVRIDGTADIADVETL